MSSDVESTLVTVTGASGFIATHCIHQLLADGYRVRGTVRSRKRCAEIEEGIGAQVDIAGRLEFVEADLTADDGWAAAVEGARYVLHVASPVPSRAPADENDLIVPAREGALRVLRASVAGGVERVVMTSSVAAVMSGRVRDESKVFDESDWSDLDGPIGAYPKSKTLAERAAWDFVEQLPEGQKLELATINPSYVFGPVLIPDYSSSQEVIGKLLRKDVPGCPRLNLSCVDVRDVARAHVAAMTIPEASGKRFVVAGPTIPMVEIARILQDRFPDRKIPTRLLPNWLVRIVALFDKTVRLIVPDLDKSRQLSSKRAQDVLGLQLRPIEEMVAATGRSLIDRGLV